MRVSSTVVVVLLIASSAFAQTPTTTRVRGTVEMIDRSVLTIRTADAGDLKVTLKDNVQVFSVAKGSLADVKPGAFIGVGAMPQPDGSQKAIQVTIFADSLRGLGEGFRPWDRPGSTMTNATVANSVASVDGQIVMLKYKDGEKRIVIPPEAVFRAYIASDNSEMKVGAAVAMSAVKRPDGGLEVSRITVGRDGILP